MNDGSLLPDLMAQLGADAAPSAAARTLDALRRRIISFDLPPDTVLSRTELAQDYEVSQTPIREALQKLESEGLVEIFPQSRTVVTRIDADKIAELVFLRRAVEVEVARVLAPGIGAPVLARLRALIELQRTLVLQGDQLSAFQELDEAFHQTMIAAAGYPGLHRLIRVRSGHLNRVRQLNMWDAAKLARILDDHTAILRALEAHDPDAAVAAVRNHLGRTLEQLDTLRGLHPQYFRD